MTEALTETERAELDRLRQKAARRTARNRTIYMQDDVWQAAVDAATAERMSVSAWLTRAVRFTIMHDASVAAAHVRAARNRGAK